MQQKTKRLEEFAELTGLRIKEDKAVIMKINANDAQPITVRSGRIEEVSEHCTWY